MTEVNQKKKRWPRWAWPGLLAAGAGGAAMFLLLHMDLIVNPCRIRYVPNYQLVTVWLALYKIRTVTRKTACKLFNQKVWLPGMGSNHNTPSISPVPAPSLSAVKFSVSAFEMPRTENVPGTSKVCGPV